MVRAYTMFECEECHRRFTDRAAAYHCESKHRMEEAAERTWVRIAEIFANHHRSANHAE